MGGGTSSAGYGGWTPGMPATMSANYS